MISIKELHGADAWRYLMESVTDAQADLREAASITRYYADAGTPPGRWLGTGLAGLSNGDGLVAGSVVSGEQMQALFGEACDPVTGQRLGRAFSKPRSYRERVAARVRRLPSAMARAERDAAVEAIKAEERRRRVRHAVYGFDYTFSPPKSVSALWAVADQGTRELITAAHHAAIDDVLALVERDVARTRIGTDGVGQVGVRGVLAAAFDHYDSREHDPQLHTHMVIANRVQGEDGKWRTLDSRGVIFPSAVAMSETYDNLLADHLTRRLGVAWEVRDPGRKMKNAKWEITGVPAELIEAFSTRRGQIETATDDLVASYRDYTGREPDDATKLKLRQRATRQTRREKTMYPLATLSQFWRAKAGHVLNADPLTVLDYIGQGRERVRVLRADDFAGDRLVGLVDEVMARLHESRSTWSVWNIRAEAARATMKYRLATAADRDELQQRLVEEVRECSLLLTPPPVASTPAAFRRADGTSVFTPEYGAAYTSRALLDAEARLLEAARAASGPAVEAETAESVLIEHNAGRGVGLGEDQAAAVWSIATSGRSLDVLVGAAGAGKTTALAVLRELWEAQHGPGSVVGLAPTAKSAEVLADTLGIGTENTAKWLTEHALNTDRRQRLRVLLDQASTARHRGNRRADAIASAAAVRLRERINAWELHPGQLLILDEASMSGTLALDALTRQAQAAGAKVLLVGDWAQLSAVESGGTFRMLVNDRGDAPELSTVRRFTHQWERSASLRLRVGDTAAIDSYLEHDRIRDGDTDDMLATAYAAWAADEQAGLRSLLIADTNATVAELNTRAHADRITWGVVERSGTRLHDGTLAGGGDRIVTRKIDRALTLGPRSWVKNGDQWIVIHRFDDGSLTVRRAEHDENSPIITLPAGYVAANVELGYATTAHRTQGDTVDTAHALVREQMSREILYVAMTRGRESNTAYVITEPDIDDEHESEDAARTARDVLEQVLAHSSADTSAHETLTAEHERVHSIAQLAAEYDTLAREARKQRWTALTQTALPGIAPADVAASPAWPGLAAAWRRAEAAGLDADTAARRLAQSLVVTDGDPVELLRQRIEICTERTAPRGARTQAHIAGLIPAAVGVSDDDIAEALAERAALIETRATTLVERAITSREPWIADLGPPPDNPVARLRWEQAATTVAAYRERHGVTDPTITFGRPRGSAQWTRRADRRRAHHALLEARQAATQPAQQHQLATAAGGKATINVSSGLAKDRGIS